MRKESTLIHTILSRGLSLITWRIDRWLTESCEPLEGVKKEKRVKKGPGYVIYDWITFFFFSFFNVLFSWE